MLCYVPGCRTECGNASNVCDLHRPKPAPDREPCNHGGVPCASWIVIRRSTGAILCELYDCNPALRWLNPEKVELLRPCVHLARFNARVKAAAS